MNVFENARPSSSAKILCLSFAVMQLLAADRVYAALLSYEGFDYPAGVSIVGQNGGTGFSQAWQLNNGAGVFTNQADSLSYTDAKGNRLLTGGGSLFLQGVKTDNGAAAQPNRLLGYVRGTNGADGGITWVSFLAVRQGPTTNHPSLPDNPYPRSANLSLYNSSPSNLEKLAMGNTALTTSNVVTLLPTGNLANAKPSAVSFSRTNLILVRIDHVLGSDFDNAYLFVNPPLGEEPSIANADASSLGEFDFTFNRIRPFAGGDRSTSASSPYAELVIDEIRIGDTFADVTPFFPVLHIELNGTEVILTWSGDFKLQTSTDDVTGPYSTIPDATSPYHHAVSGEQTYFRLTQ